MKRQHLVAALVVTSSVIAPAQGQSILDTFRQFKGTLKQLGGRQSAPTDVRHTDGPTDTSKGGGADDGQMVPASVLADDASDTALEQAAAVPRRVLAFDIRGLKLGMSPREVGRIADRAKFQRRWNSLFLTSGSFEAEATSIANFQLNRPAQAVSKPQLKAVEAFDREGNGMKLEFTLEPSGPKLSDITYTARLNGMTKQQAIAALIAKYGPPTSNDLTISWDNRRNAIDNSSPRLNAVIDGGGMTLFLRQSVDYGLAAKKRLNDRAQQIAATRGGGVKF